MDKKNFQKLVGLDITELYTTLQNIADFFQKAKKVGM